jgi:hypothetical protein
MMSFLIKVSLFTGLLLAILAGIFTVSSSSYFKYKNIHIKKNILEQKAPSYRNYMLVLGNSHAEFAINTTIITPNAINMAAPSQGMMEDYAILKQAYSLNPNIRNTILTYSYHSNTNRLHTSTRNEEVNRMFEYAFAYNIKYPPGAYTPQKYLELLANWAVYITKRPSPRNDLDAAGNLNTVCAPESVTLTGENERVDQHFSNRTQIIHTQNPYFDSIRNFCNQHQIPLTIIIPPYTRSYTNILAKQQPEAYAFINQLVAQPTQTYTVLDCRNMFQKQETRFFKDPDHLSPCGRDSFSVYLKQLLP